MNPPSHLLGWAFGLLAALLAAGCATSPAPEVTSSQTPPPAPAAVAPAASAMADAKAPEPAPATADAAVIVPDEASPTTESAELPDELARRDLWQRIREGFGMPDLDNELVRNHEQWYASRPDYVQRMTERSSRYLFHIVEEVEHRGMPTELALLPFIESAFNPQAMSTAKASGMWQFIPSTGRHFELRQNIFRDERRDVLASTRAALDYLGKLYAMFGDWQLALAAYNWGEGNVQRAIAHNQKRGLPTDYESLRMPAETRNYVPKLQAVKNIVTDAGVFNLALPAIENHPYFLTVAIQRDIDVDLAVQLADLPKAEFHALNPQMNKPVILAAGVPQILLPYDNAKLFVRNLADHRGPLASWTAWVVPKTMRPGDAAERAGMSEAELREVNKIPPRMLVTSGSTLLVRRNGQHHIKDVSVAIADNAIMSLSPEAPPLRRTVIRAGGNDTVASIAKRYRVSAAQVAHWNGVSTRAAFDRGQRIVVYTPVKGKRSATTPRAVASKSGPVRKLSNTAKAATRTAAKKPNGKLRVATQH